MSLQPLMTAAISETLMISFLGLYKCDDHLNKIHLNQTSNDGSVLDMYMI